MIRPPSHREQEFNTCCRYCRFSHVVPSKGDLLCCHGFSVVCSGAFVLTINGKNVETLQEDEYEKIREVSVVHPDDICDEFCSEIRR